MVFKVSFSSKAFVDLDEMIAHYIELNPKTAKKYYEQIIKKVSVLEDLPEMGRVVPEFLDENIRKYREIIIEHFRVIYRIQKNDVVVIRVIDSRRLVTIDIV